MRVNKAWGALVAGLALAACDGDDKTGSAPIGARESEAPGTPGAPGGPGGLALELVAAGLTSPVALVEAPDDSGRLFVVDQIGLVRVVTRDGRLQDQPFLDVRDRLTPIRPAYDERGLLGLAFHPDFAHNGRFFVYYAAPPRREGYDNTSTVAEYRLPPGATYPVPIPVGVILEEDQPQFNHEGGTLAFGPDGHLYVSIGDGGGRDDEGAGPPEATPIFGHVDDWYAGNPGGNGQDIRQNLLGNILRLDVSTPGGYTIPADNPFVGRGRGEIYAYGFRNPYRFSFDMGGAHDLLAGDAGQNMWEEIDRVVKGGNYGWNVQEGAHCFDANQPFTIPASCPNVDPTTGAALEDPVIEMFNLSNPTRGSNEGLLTIIGGHVYRGYGVPELVGRYIFGGYSTQAAELGPAGAVYAAVPQTGDGMWLFEKLSFANGPANRPDGTVGHFVIGFGQDRTGEVYVLTNDTGGPSGNSGRVYRLAKASAQ